MCIRDRRGIEQGEVFGGRLLGELDHHLAGRDAEGLQQFQSASRLVAGIEQRLGRDVEKQLALQAQGAERLAGTLAASHFPVSYTHLDVYKRQGKIPAAIHVCPEAFDGGPLARVRDGDLIRVDGRNGELLLLADEAEFASRETAARPAPAMGCGRELFAFMRHNFSTAEQGASAFTESLESLV